VSYWTAKELERDLARHGDIFDTEAKLRERVKELGCLYQVLRLAEQHDTSIHEVLQGVAELLPPAWQYPEIAHGRLVLDGREYSTSAPRGIAARMTAEIVVSGRARGTVEVIYDQDRATLHEGPFLEEERHLIAALAREVSRLVERHEARAEKQSLEEQVRHANRLATIGQMAAGVAHELNGPLGNILGFAELAEQNSDDPTSVRGDLGKIIKACLHARKIVNKLRLFARQTPAARQLTDLNEIVREGLYFLETHSPKRGVTITRDLEPNLPRIEADPGQLHQVLTNLTVNALQAMPAGGAMTIRTRQCEEAVCLSVEDTGEGMTEQVMGQIFVPFFTTKDVDQGTGLGLSVVHGIVSAHGGNVRVESSPGVGSVFEVLLPVAGIVENGED
jgi:two-component system NtrC family sensor kinase